MKTLSKVILILLFSTTAFGDYISIDCDRQMTFDEPPEHPRYEFFAESLTPDEPDSQGNDVTWHFSIDGRFLRRATVKTLRSEEDEYGLRHVTGYLIKERLPRGSIRPAREYTLTAGTCDGSEYDHLTVKQGRRQIARERCICGVF